MLGHSSSKTTEFDIKDKLNFIVEKSDVKRNVFGLLLKVQRTNIYFKFTKNPLVPDMDMNMK